MADSPPGRHATAADSPPGRHVTAADHRDSPRVRTTSHRADRAAATTESDVRAQILDRVAERRSVGASLGEPVARRSEKARRTAPASVPSAPGGSLRPDGPRHRRPPRFAATRHLGLVRSLVVFGVVTALIVLVLRTFVVASFYIPSASMETTLHGCPGCEPDLVMVEKISYHFTHIERGDIVVFTRPASSEVPMTDKELIKRVIGLPGETVSGHDGKVWIGDRSLSESYIDPACPAATTDFAPVKIPAGRYFMMGDNRCESLDSRYFGTIARNTIVGRAFAVVWPLKHWRWL